MPPKNAGKAVPDGSSAVALTENDLKFLDTIFKNSSNEVKPKPTASFDDIAKQLGLKSGKVVSDRYRQICNKVGWFMIEPSTASTAAPTAPKKTAVSRKKKAAPDVDADDEASEVSPKKRKTAKKTVKAQKDNDAELDKHQDVEEDDLAA